MKAVEISRRAAGRPEAGRSSRSGTGTGEVLIWVAAAGVNRPDLMQREGHYPPPRGASDMPGLEVAGTIAALGPEQPRSASGRAWQSWRRGVRAGLAAEATRAVASRPACSACRCRAGLPLVDAAAMPETYFTVWTNVFERGRLVAGEWLLVHGGTSGIGSTAIQLAVARGAHVIATAGSAEKCRATERARRHARRELQDRGLRRRRSTRSPTAAASTSSSTSSAAPTAEESRLPRQRGAARADRPARRRDRRGSSAADHAATADDHRLDAANPDGRGKGRHRGRARARGLAAARGRSRAARHRRPSAACRRGRSASATGGGEVIGKVILLT